MHQAGIYYIIYSTWQSYTAVLLYRVLCHLADNQYIYRSHTTAILAFARLTHLWLWKESSFRLRVCKSMAQVVDQHVHVRASLASCDRREPRK